MVKIVPQFFKKSSRILKHQDTSFTQWQREDYTARIQNKRKQKQEKYKKAYQPIEWGGDIVQGDPSIFSTVKTHPAPLSLEEEELEPFKLHISLLQEDYFIYKEKIVKRIEQALKEGVINQAKWVTEEYMERKKLDTENTRLLNGDQFTLYIPQKCDKHKLLALCNDIEKILKSAKPGKPASCEERISRHISCRQDYILEEKEQNFYPDIIPHQSFLNKKLLDEFVQKSLHAHPELQLLATVDPFTVYVYGYTAEGWKLNQIEFDDKTQWISELLSQRPSFIHKNPKGVFDFLKAKGYHTSYDYEYLPVRATFPWLDAEHALNLAKAAAELKKQSLFKFLDAHVKDIFSAKLKKAKKAIWLLQQMKISENPSLLQSKNNICSTLNNILEEAKTSNKSPATLCCELEAAIQTDITTIRATYTNKMMLINVAVAVLSVIGVFTVIGTLPIIASWKKNMDDAGNPFIFFDAIKANYLTSQIKHDTLQQALIESKNNDPGTHRPAT